VRTIKLTLAYEGTAYAGWQLQPDACTVQGVLEAAVERVTGAPGNTLAASRTDAGVHAQGQVLSLRTESRLAPDVLLRALNANLPDDVAVLDAVEVDEGFRPIRDARCKRYRYQIYDGPIRDVFRRRDAWQVSYRLDAEAMHRAAAALRGTHDFRSFQTTGAERRTTVRTVSDLTVRRTDQCNGHLIVLEIEANGFLYNMVRAIVGTLVDVGRGAEAEAWPGQVLQAADRTQAGPTAPAHGLTLLYVQYE
jgi:tRNA pseudouridine38-40 synthase